jgi:HK97 gp10 family phage protein
MMDLLGLAAQLLTVKADLKLAEEVCVEKACRMIEKEAKTAIGTYRYDWTPLKPETVARKAHGDTPLLETGELRDSIEHVVVREGKEVVGYVGTNDPRAKYHEFGTGTIPPRPFLSPALMRQEDKIHAMIVRTMWATLVRGGPHYREMRELFHILHMLYREADDFLDEDEQRQRTRSRGH